MLHDWTFKMLWKTLQAHVSGPSLWGGHVHLQALQTCNGSPAPYASWRVWSASGCRFLRRFLNVLHEFEAKSPFSASYRGADPDGQHNPMTSHCSDVLYQMWCIIGRVLCENMFQWIWPPLPGEIRPWGVQLKVRAWLRCHMTSLVWIQLLVSERMFFE